MAPLSSNKSGMIFYIVIAVVAVMSVFILFYFTFARQFAHSTFYHLNRQRLLYLSENILDSAFAELQVQTADPISDLSQQIVNQIRQRSLNATPFDLSAPIFESNKAALLTGYEIDYDLSARIFDMRTECPSGRSFYNGEALATIELILEATLHSRGNTLAQTSRRRHHDLKIACLVSNFNARNNSYAMSFPLDYALLARSAGEEFRNQPVSGLSYNQGRKLIIADQSNTSAQKRGLVYFAGANDNTDANRIFLNTTDEGPSTEDLLPQLNANSHEVDQNICFRLIPALNDPDHEYDGLRGFFDFNLFTMHSAQQDDNAAQLTRLGLSIVPGPSGLVNFTPMPSGIGFEGPQTREYFDSFLRGAVTQRFIYAVTFRIDASQVTFEHEGTRYPLPPEQAAELEASVGEQVIFSRDSHYLSNANTAGGQVVEQLRRLSNNVWLAQNRINSPMPLFSEDRRDYLHYADQNYSTDQQNESFSINSGWQNPPRFFGGDSNELSSIRDTGSEGFRPFRHYVLYTSRFLRAQELEEAGIYDRENGILNIRGVISVEFDPIEFTPPSTRDHIIVRGQGALIAPQGFEIQTNIVREDPQSDMLIMFTRRGNFRISANDRIEAAILAFNDDVRATMYAFNSFRIIGALGVDQLVLQNYPAQPITIEYDDRFRATSESEEIFTITTSPWIRYDDITFSR